MKYPVAVNDRQTWHPLSEATNNSAEQVLAPALDDPGTHMVGTKPTARLATAITHNWIDQPAHTRHDELNRQQPALPGPGQHRCRIAKRVYGIATSA